MSQTRYLSEQATTVEALGATTRRRPRLMARLRQHPELAVGAGLLIVILTLTIFAPLIVWNDPNHSFRGMSLQPPQGYFLLGTDSVGRDVFARVIYGGRISLGVAFPSVALALIAGLALGLPAGYIGRQVDQVIMRILDIFFAFPALLLAMVVVSALGPSLRNLILTIGIIYTPRMARIIRAPTLAVKERDYIEAARASGSSGLRIMLRHVLPNAASPVIVEVSLALGQAIVTEAALAYLGLGAPPPTPDWGAMVSSSRQFMDFAWWTVVGPCLAIVLATGAFLLLGQGLRTVVDPRQKLRRS